MRENLNQVTEEAVRRIQEDQKKAQQIQQQIQKDHATNTRLAKFLSILLQKITNDKLIHYLYTTWFPPVHETL